MKKLLMAALVAVGLLLAFLAGQHSLKELKTTSVTVGANVAPAQSVELTPVQQRLAKAGFDPRRVHAVTTK